MRLSFKCARSHKLNQVFSAFGAQSVLARGWTVADIRVHACRVRSTAQVSMVIATNYSKTEIGHHPCCEIIFSLNDGPINSSMHADKI